MTIVTVMEVEPIKGRITLASLSAGFLGSGLDTETTHLGLRIGCP